MADQWSSPLPERVACCDQRIRHCKSIQRWEYRYSLIPGTIGVRFAPRESSPALNATWNSGCKESSGLFSPNVPGNPSPVNCAAFEDPSAASISTGGGYVFGNLPTAVSWWRSPGYKNEDFAILKRTTIREGKDILFNWISPMRSTDTPSVALTEIQGDSFFGVPGGGGHSVINAPRQIQATLRFEF